MGRGDHEDLPPVEVLGAEPSLSSVQAVSTRGPRGPRRRRHAGLIIAVVVVGLLTTGLLLGDGGDPTGAEPEEEAREEGTTTSRRTTTTQRTTTTVSTTTTVPPGPLFGGHDLHGWVLSGNPEGWTLVDMGTGATEDPGLPFDDPYSTRAVTGGVVMLSAGEARFYDLRVPQEAREAVSLGPADQILGTVDRSSVWLVEGLFDPSNSEAEARLVDLDGRVLQRIQLPPGPYAASTPDGVVLARGGRVYLATPSGMDAIAIGDLVGAVGSSVLVFACGDDASCGVELRTGSGSLIRRLPVAPPSPDFGWSVSAAPDGRFALVTHVTPDGGTSEITLVQPDGRIIATVETSGWVADGLQWLPGDAGLVGARNERIVWIRQGGGDWALEDIPGLTSIQASGLLTILRG